MKLWEKFIEYMNYNKMEDFKLLPNKKLMVIGYNCYFLSLDERIRGPVDNIACIGQRHVDALFDGTYLDIVSDKNNVEKCIDVQKYSYSIIRYWFTYLEDKYGCDSMRLLLSTNSTPGLDMNFSTEKMEAGWNFINKLWNASRFVLINKPEGYKYEEPKIETEIDNWIISKLNYIIKQTTYNLDRYEFAIAGNELIDFVWNLV